MRHKVEVKQLGSGMLPLQQTDGAAGYDLYASEATTVEPGVATLVRCGFSIALPPGWVALVCSRSGLALRNQVFVLNAPGVVDSDYRGEVGAILFNASQEDFVVKIGDRVAQMIIQPYIAPDLVVVKNLPDTQRGGDGFGSTGR